VLTHGTTLCVICEQRVLRLRNSFAVQAVVSSHDDAAEEEPEEKRPCIGWTWSCGEASEASGRKGKRRRYAPSQDFVRQVPSGLLWESWHEVLPQEHEQVSLPCGERGQAVVIGSGNCEGEGGRREGGAFVRRDAAWLLQGTREG